MRHFEQVQEFHESELIKKRQQIALHKFGREQNEIIVSKIMKKIPMFLKKFQKVIAPNEIDEISRRFSMLTHTFTNNCVEMAHGVFECLNFTASAAELVAKSINQMTLRVILLPNIPPIECKLVQKCISELIARSIEEIIHQQLKTKMNKKRRFDEIRELTGILGGADGEREAEEVNKTGHVSFDDSANAVDELRKDEFKRRRANYDSLGRSKFVC